MPNWAQPLLMTPCIPPEAIPIVTLQPPFPLLFVASQSALSEFPLHLNYISQGGANPPSHLTSSARSGTVYHPQPVSEFNTPATVIGAGIAMGVQ